MAVFKIGGTAFSLAALLGATFLSGAAVAQDPVNLTIWAGQYTPSRLLPTANDPGTPQRVGIDEIVKAYQEANPHVTIQMIVQPIGQDTRRWLVTQLTGGVAPDIVWNQPDWAAEDYRKNWLVPLDDYLAKPNPYVAAGEPGSEKWHDLFMPAIDVWRAADDKLYVVLADQVQVGFFYNQDLLEQAGVTSVPSTWEELMDAAEKVQQQGGIPFAISGNNLDQLTWVSGWLTNFFYYHKLSEYDEDGNGLLSKVEMAKAVKAGTYAFDQQENRDRLEELKRFSSYWQPGALGADGGAAMRLFTTGRAAFTLNGSWAYGTIANDPARDFEFDVMYFPRVDSATASYIADDVPLTNKAAGYGSFQLSVPQATVERGTVDTAFDFLMFATAPENISPMIVEGGFALPAIKGAEASSQLEGFAESINHPDAPFQEDDSMLDFEFAQKFLAITSPYLGGTQSLDDTVSRLDVELQAAADRVLAE